VHALIAGDFGVHLFGQIKTHSFRKKEGESGERVGWSKRYLNNYFISHLDDFGSSTHASTKDEVAIFGDGRGLHHGDVELSWCS
jgi:hypothetical protein